MSYQSIGFQSWRIVWTEKRHFCQIGWYGFEWQLDTSGNSTLQECSCPFIQILSRIIQLYPIMSLRSWSFQLADTKLAWVIKKMNGLQGNCGILWIEIEWCLQKLGIILENRISKKLKVGKRYKNGLLNLYSQMIFF